MDLARGGRCRLDEGWNAVAQRVSTSPVWPSPYSLDMEKNLMRNCRGLSISYKCKYSSSLLEFVKRSHQTSPAILTSQRDRHRKTVKNIPFVLHWHDPEIKAWSFQQLGCAATTQAVPEVWTDRPGLLTNNQACKKTSPIPLVFHVGLKDFKSKNSQWPK